MRLFVNKKPRPFGLGRKIVKVRQNEGEDCKNYLL